MDHPIRDLTWLKRTPLNIGTTAKEQQRVAMENRKLDYFEAAMKGVDPATASWFWPAVVAFGLGLIIGAWECLA